MYAPEDRHGANTFRTYIYSPQAIIKSKNQEIAKLKQEIKTLEKKINEIENYNNFLIEGIVRHSSQEQLKK